MVTGIFQLPACADSKMILPKSKIKNNSTYASKMFKDGIESCLCSLCDKAAIISVFVGQSNIILVSYVVLVVDTIVNEMTIMCMLIAVYASSSSSLSSSSCSTCSSLYFIFYSFIYFGEGGMVSMLTPM